MKRYILDKLIKWKDDKFRKPLILKGARQVGKTYILKEFGREYYEKVAYFNFDHDESLNTIFSHTKDPKRILDQLSLISDCPLKPGKTLIIFDEIQECPNALNSLKYFNEEANEYHIVCAGSLIGIRLSHTSFPVGKVQFLDMYPMTFSEFLLADGSINLVKYMQTIDKKDNVLDILKEQFEEKLKTYFVIGGMPEVVFSWVNEKDISKVNEIQDNILRAYESDFSKHVQNSEANKISLIWNSIPSQLSKENKKFLYQVVKNGARAREYEDALNWLNDANLISKVYLVTKPSFPLKAYNDLSSFKIYLNDVGLLRKMANLDSKIILDGNKLFEEFKGALTENFIFNMLNYKYDVMPNYFTFERNEIDFILQDKNRIIPIEVKAGLDKKTPSLTKYNMKYLNNHDDINDDEISIRFSLNNLKQDGKILNIPLYLVECIDKFI